MSTSLPHFHLFKHFHPFPTYLVYRARGLIEHPCFHADYAPEGDVLLRVQHLRRHRIQCLSRGWTRSEVPDPLCRKIGAYATQQAFRLLVVKYRHMEQNDLLYRDSPYVEEDYRQAELIPDEQDRYHQLGLLDKLCKLDHHDFVCDPYAIPYVEGAST